MALGKLLFEILRHLLLLLVASMLTWDMLSRDMHGLLTWQFMMNLGWCRELIKVVLRINALLIVDAFLIGRSDIAIVRVDVGDCLHLASICMIEHSSIGQCLCLIPSIGLFLSIVVAFFSESSVTAFGRVSASVDGLTVVSIDLSLREIFVVLWIMHGRLILVIAFTPVWLLIVVDSWEDGLEVEPACWRNGFVVMRGAV